MSPFLAELEERFIRYVKIDTTAEQIETAAYRAVFATVPTPDLFTGMQEIHGPLEWVSLQDMATAETVVELVQLVAAAGPCKTLSKLALESPKETGSAVDWTDEI